MMEYTETAMDFLGGAEYIDEIKYNKKQAVIRAKNPEINGVVIVQGDKGGGSYEFLVLHDRESFYDVIDEIKECGLSPKSKELKDDESLFFRPITYGYMPHRTEYEVKIDKDKKYLYVEKHEIKNGREELLEMD